MTDRNLSESGDEVPEEIREQYEHTPLYCRECELPITMTLEAATDERYVAFYECSCKTVERGVKFPERWVLP